MNIGTTPLRMLLITAAVGLGLGPVHAAEHQPGILYGNGGERIGTISVRSAARGGVLLRVEAEGLPPGWHGMHFHEMGDCSDPAFKTAGGHVHAEKPVVHGFLVEGANDDGDLPNLHVNEAGSATAELYSDFVSLDGQNDLPAQHSLWGLRIWLSSSFLRHYDESQILLKSQPQICAISADGEQSVPSFCSKLASMKRAAVSSPNARKIKRSEAGCFRRTL